MASITKRGNTYQYTVSRMVNGQSKPIRKGGFRTKKEAQVAVAEVEASLAKGIVPFLKKVPFVEYFENLKIGLFFSKSQKSVVLRMNTICIR